MKQFISLVTFLLAASDLSGSDLITRIFRVDYPLIDSGKVISQENLKEYFASHGVQFPAGSRISYVNSNRHVKHINTAANQKQCALVMDLEKSMARKISKYNAFIEITSTLNSHGSAMAMVDNGWFSWTTTFNCAQDYVEANKNPGANKGLERMKQNFETSYKALTEYLLSEISMYENNSEDSRTNTGNQ